jgi:hypothetical protein
MATPRTSIASDPQAARQRVERLAGEAEALEARGDITAANAVWERHRWASNALRSPEDLLREGLDLIATAQALSAAARTARPIRLS